MQRRALLVAVIVSLVAAACAGNDPGTEADTGAGPGPVALLASQPADGDVDVDPQAGFRLQFDTAIGDGATPTATLTATATGRAATVAAGSMSIDLTRQNLSFAPPEPLEPDVDYELTVAGLITTGGDTVAPVTIRFRTGASSTGADRFEVRRLAAVPGATGVTFGPDGDGYATTIGGEIIHFELDDAGLPTGTTTTLVSNPDFQFIALAFEPGSSSRVWVSQWRNDPTDEFSSEIATYDLTAGVGSESKKVVGLPRHPNGNHSVQGLAFDGDRLHAAVGSMTSGGARSDTYFGEPILGENPISASIIEIDHGSIGEPIDTSATTVDASSTPVRLFATGTRNAFDLVWHSNGNLYANVNQNGGSSDENSAPPSTGPCAGMPTDIATNTIADTLNLIVRGGYYGHPNPSRNECVVMGGGQGPFAVAGYPSDLGPEPGFDPSLIASYHRDRAGSFGISVNGMDEYRGSGPLAGAILSADFAGSRSILVTHLGQPTSRLVIDGEFDRLADSDGNAVTFVHPIDVASSRTGHLLVADFGAWLGEDIGDGGAVYFLRALEG